MKFFTKSLYRRGVVYDMVCTMLPDINLVVGSQITFNSKHFLQSIWTPEMTFNDGIRILVCVSLGILSKLHKCMNVSYSLSPNVSFPAIYILREFYASQAFCTYFMNRV